MVLGAILLHEEVPKGAVDVIVYLLCLGAILFGAIRLAVPER